MDARRGRSYGYAGRNRGHRRNRGHYHGGWYYHRGMNKILDK